MGSIVAELAEKLTSATNSFDIDEQTLYVNTAADTVGIGTNSPDGKLSVHQSGTGDIFNLYDGTTNILTVVDGGALTHNGTFTIGVDDTGYDVKFFGATATNGYMLWDQSADSLVLGSSSKLGIGITAPTEKLEVAGNIKIADGGTIGSATTAGAITIAQDGVVTLVDDLVIKDGGTIGSATTAAAITIAQNGQLTLSTAPGGFNYVATVAAAQTDNADGIVISNSGTAAAGVTVAHADTSSQADVDNSGNTFIQDITLDTYGHITGITSATATDTTYSVASGTALGLVKIGYTESGKNYPVELGSGTNADKMYVNVPWTDTNTTYGVATNSALGLIKIGYTESGKNYPVELSSEKAYVNVPWTDTNTTYSVATNSALGLIKIGYSQTGKNYPVQLSSDQAYVNVPWTDTDTNTTYSAGTGLGLSGTTFNLDNGYGKIIEMHKFDVTPTTVTLGGGNIAAHTSRSISVVSGRAYHIQFTFDYHINPAATAQNNYNYAVDARFYLDTYNSSTTKGSARPATSPVHTSSVFYRAQYDISSSKSQEDQWGTKTLTYIFHSTSNYTIYPLLSVGTTSSSGTYSYVTVAPYLNGSSNKTPIYLTVTEYEGFTTTSSTT